MDKQPWMMFRVTGTEVHYLWNGEFPVLIRVGVNDGTNSDWYWDRADPEKLTEEQVKFFNETALSRKRTFKTHPHKDEVMQIVERGIF